MTTISVQKPGDTPDISKEDIPSLTEEFYWLMKGHDDVWEDPSLTIDEKMFCVPAEVRQRLNFLANTLTRVGAITIE